MNITCIFAADIHLSLKVEGWELNDSLLGFEFLFQYSRELKQKYQVPYDIPLVLAGDVWDSPKVQPALLEEAIKIRDKYPEVPIFYINGNHDSTEPSWNSFFANAFRMDDVRPVLPDGTSLAGISWKTSNKIVEALAQTPTDVDFLVVHQFIEPEFSEGAEFRSLIPGALPSGLFCEFKAVLAGDIHKQMVYPNTIPPMAYPSCTSLRNFKEKPGVLVLSRESLPGMPKPVVINEHNVYKIAVPGRPVIFHEEATPVLEDTVDAVETRIRGVVADANLQCMSIPPELSTPWLCLRTPAYNARAVQNLTERVLDVCKLVVRSTARRDCEENTDPDSVENLPSQSTMDYAAACIPREPLNDSVKTLALSLLQAEDQVICDLRSVLQI